MYSSYFWQLLKSGESYETGLSSYAKWNICLKLLEQFIPDYIIVSSFIGEHSSMFCYIRVTFIIGVNTKASVLSQAL